MTSILDTISQREQEAKEVKESGIIGRINGSKSNDELAEITDFSFNVAWHFDGKNRKQAEEKMNTLKEDAGYKIDYSKMK